MAALEAYRGSQGVSAEPVPQLPQLPSVDQSPSPPNSARLILEGFRRRPDIGVCWLFMHSAPVTGIFTTILYHMLGFPETAEYIRAHAVLTRLGQESLNDYIKYFAPHISIEELERRIALGSAEPLSEQLTKGFCSKITVFG